MDSWKKEMEKPQNKIAIATGKAVGMEIFNTAKKEGAAFISGFSDNKTAASSHRSQGKS